MQLIEIVLYNNPYLAFAKYNNEQFLPNQKIIVETNSGLEIGMVKNIVESNSDKDLVKIKRIATDADKATHCKNCQYCKKILPEIKKEAENLGLNMKIGFISTNLDQTKIIINYTADDRVDFRELIKILASKYKTKIEMRQIGSRDETKVIGAIGVCGQETCCKLFLNDFDKVSIKMAKTQNIALNPIRINGMCGRLLCCLKYEDEFYEQMQKKMPKINTKIKTPDGEGVVTSTDYLRETVTVTFTNNDSTELKIYNINDLNTLKDKKNDKN